jgi:Ni2+-binding GTPase involved in maturation of urease and hydrogenase
MDLAAAVDFNEPTLDQNIQAVRPRMQVLKLSAKTGEGMHEFLHYLQKLQRRRLQTAYVRLA